MDSIVLDNFKPLSPTEKKLQLQNQEEREKTKNFEINWIDGIKDQVDFANNYPTEYQLRLLICPTRTTEI